MTIHNIHERVALTEIWDMYHNATFFFFFSWHYNSLLSFGLLNNFLLWLSIHSHLSPIFIFPRSPLTLSSHLNLSVPAFLIATVLHSVTLFTILSLPILTICPTHLIHCAFIYLTVCLISKSISSLVLILQTTTPWLYSPCRTLASFTTIFQSSLLCARILQFVTPIIHPP